MKFEMWRTTICTATAQFFNGESSHSVLSHGLLWLSTRVLRTYERYISPFSPAFVAKVNHFQTISFCASGSADVEDEATELRPDIKP